MEKLKQNSNIVRNMKEMSGYKFKASSWKCGEEKEDMDLLDAAGFSWPPRSYTCSFCKREFRSAQALGGHMNVHRRDRARLRQFSPPRINLVGDNTYLNHNHNGKFPLLNLNLDPNPSLTTKPSFYLSSSQPKIPHFSSTILPPLLSSTTNTLNTLANGKGIKKWGEDVVPVHNLGINTGNLMKTKTRNGVFGVEKLLHAKKGYEVANKNDQYVRLELEIGLVNQSKEEVDLELRLG